MIIYNFSLLFIVAVLPSFGRKYWSKQVLLIILEIHI